MVLSELILQLQQMQSDHGDVNVYCMDCSSGFVSEVQFVSFESPEQGYVDPEKKIVIGA